MEVEQNKKDLGKMFREENRLKINVIVATHKNYQMPTDKSYLPIQVGSEGKKSIGYTPDNTGDNISNKNSNYCELTGLYWAYKNLDCDYIGLSHYRRYFKGSNNSIDRFENILSTPEIENLLQSTDIILPRKQNYYIETLYSHYSHTLKEEDLIQTRKVIKDLYPDYLSSFDEVMRRKSAHMFNMFIMKKNICDAYCDWLFSILFELEKNIDLSEYTAFQARLFGRVSELLLDVWINKNQYKYKEVPVLYVEKINWIKKGTAFLKAKFLKTKYEGSF